MPSYFLDSSALVKGYRVEVGTARINELLRSSEPLMIAQLSHLEVSSAIVRRASGSGKSVVRVSIWDQLPIAGGFVTVGKAVLAHSGEVDAAVIDLIRQRTAKSVG